MNREEKNEIDRIYKKYGSLADHIIIKEAESKDSPLHERIYRESDAKAAYKFRLAQARRLIKEYTIEIEYKGKKVDVPKFYRVKTEDPAKPVAYVIEVEILKNEDYERQIYARCVSEARAIIKRYARFRLCKKIIEGVEDAVSVDKAKVEKYVS